jgi:hypothetical protein
MKRIVCCLCVLTATVLPAVSARAAFTPATLLSSAPSLQFDEASNPAFSSDGHYVAFRGSLAGVPGIYRRDLENGETRLVAGASDVEELDAPDAAGPSISADGRYIAFTSAHDLDTADDTGSGCPEVYVRDMSQQLLADASLSPSTPKTFTLVSAANGTGKGLTYETQCSPGSASQLAIGGAQAASGVALSADGRKVAFTVLSPSDLTGPCVPPPGNKCPTEASQVAIRDLDAQTTTLVSVTPAGQPTPGGGAFPSIASEQRFTQIYLNVASSEPTASSAAISADGSTVAWQGTNVPEQVPTASDVTVGMAKFGGPALEVEPLWRRVADGVNAITKRLLGEAGVNFYFGPSHEGSEAIEGGALAPEQQAFVAPVLSADGATVAVISNGPTTYNELSYEFLSFVVQPPAEAYEVHIDGTPTSPPLVTALTETPNFTAHNATFDGIKSLAISADGTRVAFDTRRVSFVLAPPVLISPPAPEVASDYTYEVNLSLGTVQRVTSTYDGSPPNGEPGSISFSGSGLSLAFESTAGNLFYGDATPGAPQVYLVEETQSNEQPTAEIIGSEPVVALPVPDWILSATAVAQRDGSVLVDAQTPGPGRLEVKATAQLPTHVKHGEKSSRRAARSSVGSSDVRILTRTIAKATLNALTPGELRIPLRVGSAYRGLVDGKSGIYALLHVSFTARGHATLVREIPITFRRVPPKQRSKGRTSHKKAGAAR